MTAVKPYAGVVFDMDGVLLDSERIFLHIAQTTAEEAGIEFSKALYLKLMGLPVAEVKAGMARHFGTRLSIDTYLENYQRNWNAYIKREGIAAKPGVKSLLETLIKRNIPLAVATSTVTERARNSLELAGLNNLIEILIGGDQVSVGKPAPDIFLAAAKALKVQAEHCIAVEDSIAGIHAAAAAGMYTIMVPDLQTPDPALQIPAEKILPSMASAASLILKMV